MPLLKPIALIVAAILLCLPQFVLAASHKQHEVKISQEAEHAQHMNPQTSQGQLSPGLRAILNQEMGLIQQGMMDIVPAIAAGQWDQVAAIGQKIKASFILKQKLTKPQQEELHRVLPAQFIEMDIDFHKSAGMLAHAAEMGNADVVNFYFYKMNTACVSCHGKYATERFPGLTSGSEKPHH